MEQVPFSRPGSRWRWRSCLVVVGALFQNTCHVDKAAGPSATRLGLTIQPSLTAESGVPFARQPVAQLQDGVGNAVARAGVVVTATIASGAGTLGGTPTATTDAAGAAAFTDLSITGSVGDRTLSFRGTGLVSVTSNAIAMPPLGATEVLVGAGDIADCTTETDEATAQLLDGIAGTVFTAGDNAYHDGTTAEFADCYEPTWGRHKARTRPAPGNHDYLTTDAAPYYAYFGANAGPAGAGYYSFDVGDWHIVSLNSEISSTPGSAQEQWLRADLAANLKQCTLALWHKPLFSSGYHGSLSGTQTLWAVLYEFDADVVVVGHDHDYERFAPQTADGVADLAHGLREFVVGTGGADLRSMDPAIANSEVRDSDTHGVLKFTLGAGGYVWQFIPIAGETFTDSGSSSCH